MRSAKRVTENFNTPMLIALVVGAVAAVISVIGLFVSGPNAFFQAYLFSYLFWIGVSMGLMAILMLHYIVRTKWGLTIRRITEAGAGSIWVFAILFIPLVFGMGYLYPWTHPAEVAASDVLQAKTWYLNVPFFIIRAVIYFVVLILLAFILNRWSARWSAETSGGRPGDPVLSGRLQALSAVGLVVYAIITFLASVDWLMSLQPEWVSTAFGAVFALAQVLSGLAFAVLMLNLFPSLSLGRRWTYLTSPVPYQDLGALMLTLVMGWMYVAFFQMLIQWAGNIPREVIYYVMRTNGGWNWVAIFVAVFEFALPFCLLLTIRIRHNLRILAWIGGLLLLTDLVYNFWQTRPVFSPQLSISWLDIVMPIAIGGLWVGAFLWTLKRRPVLNPTEQAELHLVGEEKRAVP